MKNYYEILETDVDASKEEIKANFRRLANKYHPDKNIYDSKQNEIFQDINEAQKILLDDVKKAEYDLLLSNYTLNHYKERSATTKSLFNGKKRGIYILGIFIALVLSTFIFFNFSQERKSEAFVQHKNKTAQITSDEDGKQQSPMTLTKDSTVHTQTKESTSERINVSPKADGEIKNLILKKEVKKKRKELKQDVESKMMDEFLLAQILNKISVEKEKNSAFSNCIQVRTAENNNLKDPFEIAKVLRGKGYIISGRETLKKSFEGIIVESNGACIKITIGRL